MVSVTIDQSFKKKLNHHHRQFAPGAARSTSPATTFVSSGDVFTTRGLGYCMYAPRSLPFGTHAPSGGIFCTCASLADGLVWASVFSVRTCLRLDRNRSVSFRQRPPGIWSSLHLQIAEVHTYEGSSPIAAALARFALALPPFLPLLWKPPARLLISQFLTGSSSASSLLPRARTYWVSPIRCAWSEGQSSQVYPITGWQSGNFFPP